MYEDFDLPVMYKDEQFHFPARLEKRGYSFRFRVEVNGQILYFEPDEERNYRAVFDTTVENAPDKIDSELIRAIADNIASITQ